MWKDTEGFIERISGQKEQETSVYRQKAKFQILYFQMFYFKVGGNMENLNFMSYVNPVVFLRLGYCPVYPLIESKLRQINCDRLR